MIYVLIGIFMALVFGLCFLVDKLWQRRKQRSDGEVLQNKVRLPRANNIFGALLAVGGFALLLFMAPVEGGIWWFLSVAILLIGLFLIINFCTTGIDYDEVGFTYRRLGRRSQTFTYDQIKGQKSFANRAGINVLLYVAEEDIYLYSAMKGTRDFMAAAFQGWCVSHGINPEEVSPPNPENMIWFNEPVEDEP